MFEFWKVLILGVVEGITEWLPISSTGHLIIVERFIKLDVSDTFREMFNVVIQLGAILAVVINPVLKKKCTSITIWIKVLVACIPAGIAGVLFDELLDTYLHNCVVVSLMLILYGVFFVWIETKYEKKSFGVHTFDELSYKTAFFIGLFQMLSLIPGTSRSGVTILGALLLGTSRVVATEFSFLLAIPIMFGASGLKVWKFAIHGAEISDKEVGLLLVGCMISFLTSAFIIRFLLRYIKSNDFKIFGYYRIVMGILVLILDK